MSTDLPTSLLFIDGTNLDHRLSEGVGDQDVDYAKLFAALAAGTRLLHTYYCTADYIASPHPDRAAARAKQMRTYNQLSCLRDVSTPKGRHAPREDHCGHCKRVFGGYREKGTDVRVGSLLVHAACLKKADRLILVANDTDYEPAVSLCVDVGAKVILAYVSTLPEHRHQVEGMAWTASDVIEIDHGFMRDLWRARPVVDSDPLKTPPR